MSENPTPPDPDSGQSAPVDPVQEGAPALGPRAQEPPQDERTPGEREANPTPPAEDATTAEDVRDTPQTPTSLDGG